MDIWSPAKRSAVMARISSKNTSPELFVRAVLRSMGLRYRLNVRTLPGCPDVVLRRHGAIIFVHGCFWHLHTCRDGTIPKSRVAYWRRKLICNRDRDRKNMRRLTRGGWKVLRLWGCDIEKHPDRVVRKINKFIAKTHIPITAPSG